MTTQLLPHRHRCGAVAVVALLMTVMLTMLAVAMFDSAQLNVNSSFTSSDVERARAAAEVGARWMSSRFIANKDLLPNPPEGHLSNGAKSGAIDANQLWGSPTGGDKSIASMLKQTFDMAKDETGKSVGVSGYGSGAVRAIRSNPIPIHNGDNFTITVVQGSSTGISLPASEAADDPRILHIFSTGRSGNGRATRTVWLQYWMEKSVPHGYQGRVPLQLGKNVLVEGSIAISTGNSKTVVDKDYLQIISDFYYPKDRSGYAASVHSACADFRSFLVGSAGYGSKLASWSSGNRIAVPPSGVTSDIYNKAISRGYTDLNVDGFIDEYDVAMKILTHSSNSPYAVNRLSGATSYDPALQSAIDALGAPRDGNAARAGYLDLVVDNRDSYAKVRGNVLIGYDWNLNGTNKVSNIDGPIAAPPGTDAVTMGSSLANTDWVPATFKEACNKLRSRSGPAAGTTVKPATVLVIATNESKAVIENKVLSVDDLLYGDVMLKLQNAGTTKLDPLILHSKSVIVQKNKGLPESKQAKPYTGFGGTGKINTRMSEYYVPDNSGDKAYNRPIFRKLKLKNVIIPKGLNPYFDNCEFEGVTFVDLEENTGASDTESAGKTWGNKTIKLNADNPLFFGGKSGSEYTNGSTKQNNITFNNCTFRGPLATACPDQQTMRYNQWNIIGDTVFDNQWQDPDANNQTTATIMAPQTNIEMGSLEGSGKYSVSMKGILVAGNIDIRAEGRIDGSIVTTLMDTGDGYWHSATLGYFGPSDDWGTPNFSTPVAGLGSLVIRQNPGVAMPYGITIPLLIRPDMARYRETASIPLTDAVKDVLDGSGTFFP